MKKNKLLMIIIIGAGTLCLPSLALAQGTNPFQSVELSMPIIIGFAIIDSINPCLIGVLLLMMAVLIKAGDRKKILINGLSYTIATYITYLVGGLTLLGLFNAARQFSIISTIIYIFIGVFVLFAGLLEVKDFFWYGYWFTLSIPQKFISTIEGKASQTVNIVAAATFGFLVTLIELPCTGAPYLAILTKMSQSDWGYIKALPLLLFYNLIFVAPLLIIVILVYKGVGIKKFQSWKLDHRGKMRLGIGIGLWAIGVWIISTVYPQVFLPLTIILASIIALMAIAKYIFGFGKEW